MGVCWGICAYAINAKISCAGSYSSRMSDFILSTLHFMHIRAYQAHQCYHRPTKDRVVNTRKNRLNETALLSSKIIGFDMDLKKTITTLLACLIAI